MRALLAEGDVDQAARVLGRPHRVRGTVVHGDARGRELGFPTANLGPDATGMVPADGVYAGWLRRASATRRAGRVLPAAISIGTNPTFDGVERRVEAYVLDRTDLDLYDEVVVLEFVERLRPTLRFDGIEPWSCRCTTTSSATRESCGREAARGVWRSRPAAAW